MSAEHLLQEEVPETLALLRVLLVTRAARPPGYSPDGTAAEVDWEVLANSALSTSEKTVVYVAHGLAIRERRGARFELRLRDQILAAVQTVIEV
jgi:hypothetical protein